MTEIWTNCSFVFSFEGLEGKDLSSNKTIRPFHPFVSTIFELNQSVQINDELIIRSST